jgi:hypothetical protein
MTSAGGRPDGGQEDTISSERTVVMDAITGIPVPRLIDIEGLGDLFEVLVSEGYHVIGPACGTEPSCSGSYPQPRNCPSAGGFTSSRADTGCVTARTSPSSGTRRDRRAGSGSCTTLEDSTNLTGEDVARWERWDSNQPR